MWLHAIFCLHFLYMQCVHFMPSSIYYSYISLHSYIDLHFKCETLKTFSKLQLIFGCKIDLWICNVFKQSYGQFKHVYILTYVYLKNWIIHYTYWMYLILCIFHHVKTTWLCWWPSEFPCEHPPYLYIIFVTGCSKALSKAFSSSSHISYNITSD
jgi:hypothetical protein